MGLVLATVKVSSPRNQLDGGYVAAPLLLQKPEAVAAEFARVVYDDVVGAVVSDDVVGAVAEEFDAAALDEFAGFLVHQVSGTHLRLTTSSRLCILLFG